MLLKTIYLIYFFRLFQLMTDISVFTVEERLIAAVWVHDRIRNDMTMEDIRSAFTERFGKPAP